MKAQLSIQRHRSADTFGGWRNHYDRMLRWKERYEVTLSQQPIDFKITLDFALAYFIWCHSLRDWLVNDKIINKSSLKTQLERYDVWPLCCDIANRTRHFEINQNPTDANWMALREYDPCAPLIDNTERHIPIVLFNGIRWDISEAVTRSAAMWNDIIAP